MTTLGEPTTSTLSHTLLSQEARTHILVSCSRGLQTWIGVVLLIGVAGCADLRSKIAWTQPDSSYTDSSQPVVVQRVPAHSLDSEQEIAHVVPPSSPVPNSPVSDSPVSDSPIPLPSLAEEYVLVSHGPTEQMAYLSLDARLPEVHSPGASLVGLFEVPPLSTTPLSATVLSATVPSGIDLGESSAYTSVDVSANERRPYLFSRGEGSLWSEVRADHREFYSRSSLTWLAVEFGAGALMANTKFDENAIREPYLDHIGQSDFIHRTKIFGDGRFAIPLFAATALSEPLLRNVPHGDIPVEWGRRSFRTLLVGAVPLLVTQRLTGGSRPTDLNGSGWSLGGDNNGVSGHAFIGGIGFISAAKMTDNKWLKAGLYTASTLPGISRVNDDAHYFSQVFLGWWLAYMAATAVDETEQNRAVQFSVIPQADGAMAQLDYIW